MTLTKEERTKGKEAWQRVGGLSAPSKMPCFSYSIPAKRCQMGGKLFKVKGSVCAFCYALKGRYLFPNVQNALERRFASLASENWVADIVCAISANEKSGFFRWHDSGDLQGVWHLRKLCQVAEALPQIRFWLPTREYSFVSDFVKEGGKIPANLTVRLSGYMLEGVAPEGLASRLGVCASSVSSANWNCPSSKQGNKCQACRLCWDNTKTVTYKKH